MDAAGLFAICLAAVVVYWLARHQPTVAADAPCRHRPIAPMSGRRAKHAAVLAVALSAVLLTSFISSSRDLATHLEKAEAKIMSIEQTIQNHNERIDSLASVLSKNSDDIKLMTYKATEADGTPNSESSITVDDDIKIQQPSQGETMDQEFPKRSDDHQEDAPAPGSPDEATEPHKPWRFFPVPEGQVFVVECVGDELTVRIRPDSHGGSEHSATGDDDQQLPFTCGHPPEAGTPSFYDGGSYGALFWSRPMPDRGLGRVLPVPWPLPEVWNRLTTAVLEGTWAVDGPMVDKLTPPESMKLSTDMVMFYRPWDGRTKVLIAAREDVRHLYYSIEEEGGPAVTALAPYSILPMYAGSTKSPSFFFETFFEKNNS